MRRQLDVCVLEADDEPERDVLVAHRVDPGAAELPVAGALAERPAHRVDDLVERPRDLPDLLHPERPDLGVLPLEAEVVDRRRREVPCGALGENGHLCRHVDPGLEVRERLAVLAAPLVTRPHADHAAVVEKELLPGRLGEDHRAAGFGLLGEEASELGDRDDPVAVVHHRRRRRDPERRALREQVDRLPVHGAVGRHLLDRDPPGEEPADRARVHHRARRGGASPAACPSRAPRPARRRAAPLTSGCSSSS